MLNTYLYSSVAFRSKSSPYYYSSNDYYLLNNRVNNTPSSSSCTCCAIPFNGVPLNPSLFYGFRQSTLIHLLPTNRLMLGGADRFRRIPTCDFDTFSCGSSCSVNQACQCCCTRRRDSCMSCDFGTDSRICKESCLDRSTSRRRRGKERRFKCMVWEEKDDSYGLGIDETTEAMLGLLAEEKTENSIPVKGWRSRLAAKSIQEERKTSGYSKKKKDPESDYLEKGSKGTFQSGLKLREHDCKSLGRRESSLKVENHNLRKDGSSCSSYYTALSPDEIDMSDVDGIDGSDLEVRVKHGKFSGESSSMNKKELRRGKEDVHVKNVRKQAKQKDEDAFGYRDVTWEGNSVMGSTRVGVGSDRHMRNTREKKITDVSVQEGESRSESIKRSSDVMQNHTNGAEMTIDGQDHFRDRGNNSISSSYSVDATEQCGEQDESGRNFQRSSGKLEAEGRYFESVSNSQTQLKGRKNNLSAAPVNISKEERKTVRQAAQGVLNSHDTNTGTTSASERQFESTSKNREESSTSSVHMAEGKSYSTDQRVVWETKPTKQSQHPSNVSVISDSGTTIFNNSKNIFETRMSPQEKISAADVSRLSKNHDNNIRSTSTSPRFSGSSAKNREEISTSLLSSVRNAEDQHGRAERFVSQVDSPRDSHGRPNISAASVSDVMVIGVPLKPLERRISPKEEHSASRANLFKEVREENTQLASEHTIKQLESRDQPKRLIEMSSFGESSADMASSSQPLQFSQQASEKQMGEQKESWRNSQKKMAPLPSQIVEKASKETMRYQEPTDKNATGNVHSEKSGGEHSTLTNQEAAPSSLDESNSGTKIDKVYDDQSNMYHEDALGSASRLEESSMQFVQQFVEHLSHEVSATELPEKKLASETTSIYKDVQQSFVEQIPEDVHLKVPVSGRSLSRSGARGPSDEMWDVAGPSAEVPARTEAPSEDTSTSKSAIVRSGRSLWNIFGDIVRFRWGARSGGKSSSNESGGSEAWFSSHEADEKDDENVKKGRRSMPKGHGPSGQTSLVRAGTQSGSGASEGTSSNSKRLHPEGDTSSSLDTAVGQLASKAPSLVSKEEGTSQQFGERSGSQGIPSRNTTASPSLSRHLMRSPAVKGEIAESSKPVASRSDLIQMEQPLREIPIEGPGTEVKDGELKRRKLQKNKQVERETFEEWEEAYRVESDQRKIDEMFMREALLEAKKAADTWEVPVGAVLVQHGKIIARGCNLVEDLRDSTAHAEMICIREASKTLRTWRLAETTLYVTLEPCAMCAGAILQARVDTVVWGAPNKLLGADGSWVRLFPGGGEVGSTSELSSQPAGPIHPFHPKITVRRGILATECADIMQQFFRLRRKKDNKLESPPTSSLSVSTHPSKFISKMHDIFGIMFCL